MTLSLLLAILCSNGSCQTDTMLDRALPDSRPTDFLYEATVMDVLRDISKRTGRQFSADPQIQGQWIVASAKDATPRDMLAAIAATFDARWVEDATGRVSLRIRPSAKDDFLLARASRLQHALATYATVQDELLNRTSDGNVPIAILELARKIESIARDLESNRMTQEERASIDWESLRLTNIIAKIVLSNISGTQLLPSVPQPRAQHFSSTPLGRQRPLPTVKTDLPRTYSDLRRQLWTALGGLPAEGTEGSEVVRALMGDVGSDFEPQSIELLSMPYLTQLRVLFGFIGPQDKYLASTALVIGLDDVVADSKQPGSHFRAEPVEFPASSTLAQLLPFKQKADADSPSINGAFSQNLVRKEISHLLASTQERRGVNKYVIWLDDTLLFSLLSSARESKIDLSIAVSELAKHALTTVSVVHHADFEVLRPRYAWLALQLSCPPSAFDGIERDLASSQQIGLSSAVQLASSSNPAVTEGALVRFVFSLFRARGARASWPEDPRLLAGISDAFERAMSRPGQLIRVKIGTLKQRDLLIEYLDRALVRFLTPSRPSDKQASSQTASLAEILDANLTVQFSLVPAVSPVVEGEFASGYDAKRFSNFKKSGAGFESLRYELGYVEVLSVQVTLANGRDWHTLVSGHQFNKTSRQSLSFDELPQEFRSASVSP